MRNLILLLSLLFTLTQARGQSKELQAGPMVGYVDMLEAMLWVQTVGPAEVQIQYRELGTDGEYLLTAPVETQHHTAYTAKLLADRVQPGRTYDYDVLVDGKVLELPYPTSFRTQSIWAWRTAPPDFKVALGSCVYINEPEFDRPGAGYGSEYEIFGAINAQRPDLMLWLGDNTYLRETDWWTRTGILHRHTHTRSTAEMQPLLAHTPNYAIWDDHDYGPNNSDRSWINKEIAKEAFDLFWANPGSGLPGQGGITTMFRYNDVDVFLLDNRYFRTPNDQKVGERTILGETQLEWIIESLIFSNAKFKLVCIGGQVLNSVERFENYINLAPEERAYLLRRIDQEDIKNVIFLSGDRHHSELSALELPGGNMVYDMTASSLTSGTGNNRDEVNTNRVEGTLVVQHNFGLLEFSGPWEERQLKLKICDATGKVLWEHSIMAQ
ncbi:MAG: alkaline phosphatase D family protein [Bacteroidota bacterium]